VATYELLRSQPNILASRLLYHRIPVQYISPRLDLPQDIAGHHLFLFERAEGEKNTWQGLSPEQKVHIYISNLFYSIQFNYTNLLSRPAFLLSQLGSAYHYSISISRWTSPLFSSANASLNRSQNCFPFLLPPHASFALLFLYPRSKRQSGA
jgi:hypothetical protein